MTFGGSDNAASRATILIFGASGDLTARKLLPACYLLWNDGYLNHQSAVIGVARREKTDESFRNEMFDAVNRHARTGPIEREQWDRFSQRLFYRRHDLADLEGYGSLKGEIDRIESSPDEVATRIVYLATAPSLFRPISEALDVCGLVPEFDHSPSLRVVFEKPFGRDLESARELTNALGRMLREEQIYRIDHYLGKETVQNVLLFRFGNAIFEPLLSRNHVDTIQITVAESQGMERGRGAYYDRAGALRDVLQNHVLQLMCLVAMEPPALFQAQAIRDEKLKVLQALRPGSSDSISEWAVAGQYTAGVVGGESACGYREEDRVS